MIDAATRDDAAVFLVSPERAIVATLDFFSPIVDDAYDFGAIAAANAFSDVYAMGATPLFALNLVAWPRDTEMLALLADTMRGGSDIAAEAGVFVLGGHSVDDAEPKYGMVVIGEAHPDEIISNSTARPGDSLILTKPLGTGILATALKRDEISEEQMQTAVDSMKLLNRSAAEVIREHRAFVRAATDITGFGLLGHLNNMTEASGVGASLTLRAIPVFEGVRDLIGRGVVPGGTRRNLEAANAFTDWNDASEMDRLLLSDAQTSGGLLIAVASEHADVLVEDLRRRGAVVAATVGTISEGKTIRIEND